MAAAFAPAQAHLIACTKYGALVLGITGRVLPDSERALTEALSVFGLYFYSAPREVD